MKIRKKALSLFLALTMVVGTFASTVAFATTDATGDPTDVSDIKELKTALANENTKTINITKDILGIDASLVVDRAVTINGGDHRLTFTGLEAASTKDDGLIIEAAATVENLKVNAGLSAPQTWVGTYAIHVYNTTATLKDVTVTNGNGGILVNGSNVTLAGAIDVSGNGFGGIEVSKGKGLSDNPSLKVADATFTNKSEVYGLPTIWEDGVAETVTGADGFTQNTTLKADQIQYYMDAANAEEPVSVGNLADLKAAIADENTKTINITADIENIPSSIIVNRPVTINGWGHWLKFTGLEKADGTVDDGLIIQGPEAKGTKITCLNVDAGLEHPEQWVGTYAIHVYNTTDVTLESVIATGGNGGILVNGSEVELTGTTAVGGNEFGGIEVSKGAGLQESTLTVSGALVNDTEAYGQPTIWVVDGQGSIAGNPGVVLTSNDDIADGQTQYYLDAAKSGKPVITLRNVPATVTTEEKVPENEYGKITSFTPDNRTPIKVALTVGKKGYQKVRVVVEGLNDGVQLIAKDTSGNWYNIVKTGWGPTDGFELADATTDVYLVANATGNYEATIKLVDVSNSNKVLAMATTSGIALDPAALAEVSDIGSLKTALANGSITTINITKDISNIDAALIVNHEVTVNGQGHKLTFTNKLNNLPNGERQGILVKANDVTIDDLTIRMAGATDGWQGVYGIQVYNVTGVTLNNVTTSGADGGILVNGSEVELTGTTAVGGNEFGGIEVSKGTGLQNSKLTVTGALVNDTEVYKQPTIWLVNEQGTVNSVDNFTQNATINNEQTQYYIMSAHAYAPTTSSAAQTAIDAVKGISSSDAHDYAKEIKTAVQSVQCLNNEDKAKLKPADIKKLDELLTAVVDGSVTTEVAAPETSDIPNPIDRLTHEPAVSGLLLAAGITGSETTSVSLRTTQVVPTGSGSVLALQLDLTVGGNPIHTLLVPVTVKIQLPSSFVYNPSSKDYKIQHVKNDGTSEDLQLAISGVSGAYTGTFTTSSFSTFTVVGTKKSSPNPGSNPGSGSNPGTVITTPTATFVSDTTTDFNVNGAYQFKITSTNGQAPTLVVGTAGVFNTQLVKTEGNDYYFKLTAIGAPGARAGVYVNGVKLLIATVASTAATVKCDTTLPFNVKAGAAYTFKITADAKPSFAAGTSTAFKVEFVKVVGKDYFFKVTAVGKVGAASGFYINSQKAPVTVATITK